MIKGEHLHEEIKKIEELSRDFEIKDKDLFKSAVLKVGALVAKLLLNIRQNQTKLMEKQGVELIVPKGRNEKESK